MVKQLSGLLDTDDLTEWEEDFVGGSRSARATARTLRVSASGRSP
jgi:hypothetical protein